MSKETYRETRNYQTEQEAIFLYLLNKYCSIVLIKPIKRSSAAQHFFRIKMLEFGANDIVEVNKIIEQRLNERFNDDVNRGVTEKTARRRSETGRFAETLHLLMDLLSEFGYIFGIEQTKGRNGSMIVQTAKEIFKDGECCVNRNEMLSWGSRINKYLLKIFERNEKLVLIQKNDANLQQSILHG